MEIPRGSRLLLWNTRNSDNRDGTTNRREQMESQEIKERNIQKSENGTDKYVQRGHQPCLPLRKPWTGYKRIWKHFPGQHYGQYLTPLRKTELPRARRSPSPPQWSDEPNATGQIDAKINWRGTTLTISQPWRRTCIDGAQPNQLCPDKTHKNRWNLWKVIEKWQKRPPQDWQKWAELSSHMVKDYERQLT